MSSSPLDPRASAAGAAPPPSPAPRLFRNVVALGIVSMFTDVSSEMLVPILPLFITGTLHASVASLGIIEGVAESVASLLRLSSGWLSDRTGSRKPFLVFGYGLSTVAKATMAVAASWPAVMALRFTDRVGKGLRNPPRDALIADSVAPEQRGRAYGLHRGLDTLGAAIGPLVAFVLLGAFPGDFRRLFLISAIPAVISIFVLIAFVTSPPHASSGGRTIGDEVRALSAPFKRFLVADGIFQLGNSSMAFVLLRASHVGFDARQVPLVYVAFNLAYALLSYPVGQAADRVGRRPLLLAAYALYAVAYAWLALTDTRLALFGAFLLLGLQMALIEVSQRSLVADFAGRNSRGTAFGIYHTVVGLALLPASVLAGWLWDRFGAPVTFGVDAALALVAALLFALLLPMRGERRGVAA